MATRSNVIANCCLINQTTQHHKNIDSHRILIKEQQHKWQTEITSIAHRRTHRHQVGLIIAKHPLPEAEKTKPDNCAHKVNQKRQRRQRPLKVQICHKPEHNNGHKQIDRQSRQAVAVYMQHACSKITCTNQHI